VGHVEGARQVDVGGVMWAGRSGVLLDRGLWIVVIGFSELAVAALLRELDAVTDDGVPPLLEASGLGHAVGARVADQRVMLV
jgi:hypothetical protein